jgi:hypothetical protein
MTLEERLADTLRSADAYEPSPDLFAKVQRSILEDRAHRRRVGFVIGWLGVAVVAIGAYLAGTVRVTSGEVTMAFTSLEVLVTVVMVAIVVVLGPAIRRFGETYERAVFSASPETGAQVLRLLDIAYYLVFGAFILVTLMFEPPRALPPWDRQLSDQVTFEVQRIGGLLLMMGLLHVGLTLALPIVGLVHSANLRRARIAAGRIGTDEVADTIDRRISVAVWMVTVAALGVALLVVVLVLLIIGSGG